MNYSLSLATLAVAGVIYSQAKDILPPQYKFDRYSKMIDQSPFAIATVVAAPAAAPDFAKDLYIANAARSQDGDLVTIASGADHNFKKYLTTKEPVDGYIVASIEWSEEVGETKVTISKDGNFATLTFNQARLSQGSPGGPMVTKPQPAPVMPVPNAAGVPNAHAPKSNLPLQLQLPSRNTTQPHHSIGSVHRSPKTTTGSIDGAQAPPQQ